jgi:maleate cis-trans isomerase
MRSVVSLITNKIDSDIILHVVLYGCETWSLTIGEEHGLRAFENRVLRRIFGAKREEVVGDWRRMHNEEPHNL